MGAVGVVANGYKEVYAISGTNKRADDTDYVSHIKANNGMVIKVVNANDKENRFYEVYNSEKDMDDTFKSVKEFNTLKKAKRFVETGK